jgi:hypothetical protein
VAVAREREAGVVAELASDVDDAAAFVEEEAREAVAQRVGRGLVDLRALGEILFASELLARTGPQDHRD